MKFAIGDYVERVKDMPLWRQIRGTVVFARKDLIVVLQDNGARINVLPDGFVKTGRIVVWQKEGF